MLQPYILFAILLITLGLFIWGYWRYDIVAMIALMAGIAVGAVPFHDAFKGFSSPAVVTVACVMIISQAIARSGVLDILVKRINPMAEHPLIHIGLLCVIAAFLSAFMNNVGALALLMPVAIQTTIKSKRSPSMVLMPLSFASVLGGMCTAIGTPPNILIANYRSTITGHPFAMFDFSPVGIVVAIAAISFIFLIGWRLLPQRRKSAKQTEELFRIQDYITEVKITEGSNIIEKTIREVEKLAEGNATIIGLIRNQRKRFTLSKNLTLHENDILLIEATHDDLEKFIREAKVELVQDKPISADALKSEHMGVMEAVVPQGSRIERRSSQSLRLRSRYHLNLLAIAREGKPFKERLNHVILRAGDVLLLQGEMSSLQETVVGLGLLPLVQRGVQVGMATKGLLSLLIFACAIALTALQVVPAQIAFAGVVLALVVTRIMPVRTIYDSIDWSIVVLLGAMIPLGGALQATGGTDLIARTLVEVASGLSPMMILGLLLLLTMSLSDVMNNAATAVVMAPIAASMAQTLGVNTDPFLMAVAVGASCSFLTPISHQNNTLVMGPGGYHFGDYFRLGLPVELIVLVTSVPLILMVWPL